jgi:hypothetical protein
MRNDNTHLWFLHFDIHFVILPSLKTSLLRLVAALEPLLASASAGIETRTIGE